MGCFEEFEVGTQTVLSMGPTRDIRIGRERLDALRAAPGIPPGSATDDAITRAIEGATGHPTILVLRGATEHGTWAMQPDLSRPEREELGYHLMRSHLPLYRRLLELGIWAHVRVDWGPNEIEGLEAGAARLAEELAAQPEAKRDHWILQVHSQWLLTSYEDCKAAILPRIARVVESRRRAYERTFGAPSPT